MKFAGPVFPGAVDSRKHRCVVSLSPCFFRGKRNYIRFPSQNSFFVFDLEGDGDLLSGFDRD